MAWTGRADFGDAPHAWDSATVKRGGYFRTEDGQTVFTDGQGNKYWLQASASASANSIVCPSAAASVSYRYTVKRKDSTVNQLKVRALSGNVEGTATFAINTARHAYTFFSDGSNYYIISSYTP